MEFKLSKYTNFLSKMKEKIFILKNEEIRIKNPDEENFENVNNLDLFAFSNINLHKLHENKVSINCLEENMFLYSSIKSDVNSLPNFINFFNFLKYVYKLYLFYSNYEKDELFRFNIKEYIANLKQYTRNDILILIINNIKEKENDMKTLLEITKNKIEELKGIPQDSSEFRNFIVNIDSDFRDFLDKFFENSKILDSIETSKLETDEMNPVPYISITNSTMVQNNSLNFSYLVSQIEIINDLYFALSRLLIEMKKSSMDILMKSKNNQFKKNDSIKKLVYRLIKKDEKEFNSKKKSQMNQEEEISNLESKYEQKKSENLLLKDNLREFLAGKCFQTFFCFKCGNLLKRITQSPSTCKFDSKCKNYSNFTCQNCNIDFCPICVVEITEQKCGLGHLIFEYNGIIVKSCLYCEENINDFGYSCNLCDLFICEKCFEISKSLERIKCVYCNLGMVFKTGQYEKCLNCLEFKECPWKCFFCNYDMCDSCNTTGKTSSEYCGQLHLMKRLNLADINYDPNKLSENISASDKNPTSKLSQNQVNNVKLCSTCGEFLYLEYLHCNRCLYLKCQNCFEKIK